jgi:hypothetical protein
MFVIQQYIKCQFNVIVLVMYIVSTPLCTTLHHSKLQYTIYNIHIYLEGVAAWAARLAVWMFIC